MVLKFGIDFKAKCSLKCHRYQCCRKDTVRDIQNLHRNALRSIPFSPPTAMKMLIQSMIISKSVNDMESQNI